MYVDLFIEWIESNQLLLGTIAGLSTVLLLVTILATPWLVAMLPSSYFITQESRAQKISIAHVFLTCLRSLIGLVLVLIGIVMLVIPGPGLITLLVGLSLAEFPGKRRLLKYIATRPSVFKSLNWMRKRHDREPFELP